MKGWEVLPINVKIMPENKKHIFLKEILGPLLLFCSTYFLAATFPPKMEW